MSSGADEKAIAAMITKLATGRYDDVAEYATRQSGNLIPTEPAKVITTDAQTLHTQHP